MDTLKQRVVVVLKKFEPYVKTDMVYLFGGSFWITVGQAVGSISAFVLAILFARFLSPTEYGLYKYVLSLVGIVSILSITGMGTAVTQAVASGKEGALREGIRQSLRWSLGMALILLGIGAYYLVKGNTFLGVSMLTAGFFQPFISSLGLYGSYLVGKKLFADNTKYHALTTILSTLALAVTLYVAPEPIWVILAYFISSLLGSALAYILTVRRSPPKNDNDPGLLGYATNLSVMGAVAGIAGQIDKIVVFQFVGAVELAVYAFAVALPEQVWGILKGLGNLMLPKFATHQYVQSNRRPLLWKMTLLGGALLGITLLYVVVAPILFKILFPAYMDAIPYSQVYALSLLALTFIIPTSMLTAQKSQRELYIFNVGTSLLQIILIVPMAMAHGLWGVIITRIVVRYTQLFMATAMLLKKK